MLFIDSSEGVSGDMLLAALLGLLEGGDRHTAEDRIVRAGAALGIAVGVLEVEDSGDTGLAVAYSSPPGALQGRSRAEAFAIIERAEAELGSGMTRAREMLGRIFEAEARAHAIPEDEVHLHELGRPEALLNLAAIGSVYAMLENKGAGEVLCSVITTGKGTVMTSHGPVKVPAPASRHLLGGWRHAPGADPGERATPTGIAALTTLAQGQVDGSPPDHFRRSVGFGSKRFGGRLGRIVALLVHRSDLTKKGQGLSPLTEL